MMKRVIVAPSTVEQVVLVSFRVILAGKWVCVSTGKVLVFREMPVRADARWVL